VRDITPHAGRPTEHQGRPRKLRVLRRNGKLSAEAIRDAMAHAKPGMYEYQIEARARFGYMNAGAQGVGLSGDSFPAGQQA